MKKEVKVGKRILVTGGSGFLGSHICDSLSDAGHEVNIFDLKKSAYLKKSQKMILGDVLKAKEINKACRGIDIIFHLAALANMDAAHNQPYNTMNINVLGTVNVLEAARENKVKRVMFASTIYVNSRTGSFYRVSKHAGELLLEAYHQRYGLDYTILRFGTLYGPRSNENNSVFKYLKEALLTGKIDFMGTGDEVREYIHVRDAALVCTRILADEFKGETLILTGHHRMRLREFMEIINEILSNKVKVNYHPEESRSHYNQTPYSYIPNIGKKIITDTYCDFGQSLLEILHEIDPEKTCRPVKI